METKSRRSSQNRLASGVPTQSAIHSLERRILFSAPNANWKLDFGDEFSGSSLDTSKWSMYLPWTNSTTNDNRYHNSSYVSYMMPDDVNVSNGTIKLTTQKRNVTVNGTTFNYTEGMITTNAHYWNGQGYYEMRANLPTGAGNWPAFWTLANGWPPEDDIMEAWPSTNRVHQGAYNMSSAWDDYNTYTSIPSGWHTWSMEWGPSYQKFYIDDNLKYTTSNGSAVPQVWQYILLNSGVQSGQQGGFSNSNNNTFEVDYVHVYDYSGSGGLDLLNTGFDSGSSATGWTSLYGGWSVNTPTKRTGDKALKLSGANAGAEQVISGLQPNTTYTFSGWGKSDGGDTAYFGVKDYGGSQVLASFNSSTWTQKGITFTTGPTDTSARVFCYKSAGSNAAYFDDTDFIITPTIVPVGDRGVAASTTTNVSLSLLNTIPGISISATSSDQSLIPDSGLVFSGSGNSRKLAVTPVTAMTGSATITLTLTDPFGTNYVETFVVTVTPSTVINGDQNSSGQADLFRLVRNGASIDVYRNNVTSTPDYALDFATTSIVAVNGLGGDDTLVIDYIGGDPIPTGGVSFDGGTQTANDTVSILGGAGDDAATLVVDQVQINDDFVSLTNTETLSVDLGGGSNTLDAQGLAVSSRLAINAPAGGTLSLLSAPVVPTNTDVTVAGTLNTGGFAFGMDVLAGSGAIVGGGNLTVGKSNGSGSYSGSIADSATFTKTGSGMITLSGASTFTGSLTLNDGVLVLANSLAAGSTVNTMLIQGNTLDPQLQLSSGAAVQLAGITIEGRQPTNTVAPINNLSGINVLNSPITLTVGGSDYRFQSDAGKITIAGAVTNATANSTARAIYLQGAGEGQISGAITNNGSTSGVVAITKNDAGTWTLSGANTFAGVTTINSGALRAASAGALGTTAGNTFLPGNSQTGRLEISGGVTVPEPLSINGRPNTNTAPVLMNYGGDNVLTGALTCNTGGNEYRIQADAGKLSIQGALTNATATTSARLLYLQGAATGLISGVIGNASGTTGAMSVTKLNSGTWTLSGVNTFSGGAIVSAGTVIIGNGDALAAGALAIADGAGVTLANSLARAAKINSLTMTSAARLDLANSAMVIDYSGSTIRLTIESLVTAAYAGGNWSANGITSSFAIASPGTAAVGLVEASDLYASYPASFAGQSVADNTAILLRGTRPGDANVDAAVDSLDFNLLLAGYGGAARRWFNADCDYNAKVNTLDFNLLAGNFGASVLSGVMASSHPSSSPASTPLQATPSIFGAMPVRDDNEMSLL